MCLNDGLCGMVALYKSVIVQLASLSCHTLIRSMTHKYVFALLFEIRLRQVYVIVLTSAHTNNNTYKCMRHCGKKIFVIVVLFMCRY